MDLQLFQIPTWRTFSTSSKESSAESPDATPSLKELYKPMNLVCFASPSKKMCPRNILMKEIHSLYLRREQCCSCSLWALQSALFLRKSLETTATVRHVEQTSRIHTLLKQTQTSFPSQSLLRSCTPQWRLLNPISAGGGKVKEQHCGNTDLSKQTGKFMGFTHHVCSRWASALFSHVFNKLFFPRKEPPQRCGFIWNDI